MPTQIENVTLYDAHEIAIITAMHINTIRSYCANDILPAKKLDKSWYMTHRQLVEYLKTKNLPESIIEHRLKLAAKRMPKAKVKAPAN